MKYKLITERIHLYAPNIHVCFAAELCAVLDPGAVWEAIKKVMLTYPLLRSSVCFDENGNAFFQINENIEPDFRIEKLHDEKSWVSVVAREQEKPFELEQAPLIRFTCLQNESKMQLVMCVHHILADGLSCVTILKTIMFFIQNPSQAAEAQAVKLPENTPLYNQEKLSFPINLLVNSMNRRWSKAPHIFTGDEYRSMRQNYWARSSHSIITAELSAEKAGELAEKCHQNSVTINSLLVSTLLECSQRIDRRNKKAGLAVSVRPDKNSFGNYASGVSIEYKYDRRKSVWENALAVQKLVKRKQNNIGLRYFYLTFLKSLDAGLIDSMYFSQFGNFSSKPAMNLRKTLGYIEEPLGLGTTNLGKTELSSEDGINSVYFIPPLIANTDKIVGIITTASGLRVVYQYSNQINPGENRRIFEDWIGRLLSI